MFVFLLRRFSREPAMSAKDVRREVVREVTEWLEEVDETVKINEVDTRVAGNIHRDHYREFWMKVLKPDA